MLRFPQRLRVLVVGAGFGGLSLVRHLRDAPVDVTLLDQNNYHLFTPLLYQVASALLDPSQIAQPVRAIVRRQRNVHFRMGQLTAIDFDAGRVDTTMGPVGYDRLVLATGSVNNFFGNDSVERHSFPLKELGDAIALRNHVLSAFECAAVTADPAERRRLETIAVAGAGPTGVECSGAFAELSRLLLRRDFKGGLDPVDIELLEAAPAMLATFAGSLQHAAQRTLERKGVHVRLQTPVRELRNDGTLVLADGGLLEAATVIWTAGVKASPAGELLGVELSKGGRVPVDEWMRVQGRPGIYTVGDLAEVRGPEGPHPMLAPVAMQQAAHVARQIAAEVKGEAQPGPFRYFDKGTMATIGRNAAIAQIGPLRFTGFIGWVMWLVVHLVLIISFRSRLLVLLSWAWNYLLFDRPVRLIASAKRHEDDPPCAPDEVRR